MAQTLWGENVPRPRRSRRKAVSHPSATPYVITGAGNDCEIFGHTLNAYDLAGCTTCMDCGVRIFCPRCIERHPRDANAVPVMCERHEQEGTVHHAV